MASDVRSMDFSQLSVAERIILVEQIWDSIATEQVAVPLTPAQEAELDRRMEAHRKSPQEGASWEEVKARIQGKR
jgi:putative addiction module component (TIGR02574 family)